MYNVHWLYVAGCFPQNPLVSLVLSCFHSLLDTDKIPLCLCSAFCSVVPARRDSEGDNGG